MGEQCSRPHRCRQTATGLRVQLFCSSCTMWYKGKLIPGERLSLTHRVSKDSTLNFRKKKLGKYSEKSNYLHLRSLKHEQVYHNRLSSLTNEVHHKVTRKKPSWLTCIAWKASSKLMTKIYEVHRARVEIITLYQLCPQIFLKR